VEPTNWISTKEWTIIKESDQEIEEQREKEQQPKRWTKRETNNQRMRKTKEMNQYKGKQPKEGFSTILKCHNKESDQPTKNLFVKFYQIN
jgi:arylamine N-acetyltransferase